MRRKKEEISRCEKFVASWLTWLKNQKGCSMRYENHADVKLTPIAKRKEELAATQISQKIRRSNCHFFFNKTFHLFDFSKIELFLKKSLQKLKPYSWINAALAGKNKQVWSNTSARIFTDHKYLLLSASFQSASFHLSYFEGIKIARERTLSLLGLWRVNFSILLCIL